MKSIAALLVLTLWPIFVVGQKPMSEDDPQWRTQTVQRAFKEVSAGMYYSWSEKWLARLGDGAAPEIMSLVAAKGPSKKDVQQLPKPGHELRHTLTESRSPEAIPKSS
jgi:hypothetical protein